MIHIEDESNSLLYTLLHPRPTVSCVNPDSSGFVVQKAKFSKSLVA